MTLRCRCGEVVGQHEAYPGAGVEDVYALCPVHGVVEEPPDDWTWSDDKYDDLMDKYHDAKTLNDLFRDELKRYEELFQAFHEWYVHESKLFDAVVGAYENVTTHHPDWQD